MNKFLKIGLLSSTLSLGLPSCQKAPLKEVATAQIPPIALNRVDSFISESKKVLLNTKYQTFKKDTVKITKDFYANPIEFFKNLNKEAKSETPRVVVRTYTVMVPSVVHKWRVVEPQTRHEYAKKFVEPRAVIQSNKFFTRDSVDLYVTVEYVGIPNPELELKK